MKLPSALAAHEASATIVGQVLNLTTAGMWPVPRAVTSVSIDPLGYQVSVGAIPSYPSSTTPHSHSHPHPHPHLPRTPHPTSILQK